MNEFLIDWNFLKDFFDADHLKSLYRICHNIPFVFYVLAFWPKACGILAPQPGIEPVPPALEGDFLAPGPPGKS